MEDEKRCKYISFGDCGVPRKEDRVIKQCLLCQLSACVIASQNDDKLHMGIHLTTLFRIVNEQIEGKVVHGQRIPL